MKEIIVKHFLDYEFVYIFLLSSILFLLISMFIKQRLIKKILVLSFSIFFVLFVFEFGLSFFTKQYYEDKWDSKILNVKHSPLLKENIEIGFVDKETKEKKFFVNENIDTKFLNKDKFIKFYNMHCSIYENTRFRYTQCNEKSKDSYIFLGCSFTFGDGLNDDETLPYFFSKVYNFKQNIINYGISGKSFNSALSILKTDLLENIKYKHFFYSLINYHINRNFTWSGGTCNDMFVYDLDKWYKIEYPFCKFVNFFKRSYIFVKILLPIINDHNRYYYEDYMIDGLKEMNKIIEEKYNSKLTIIVWPDDYGERFNGKLKETNLDLIYLPDYFNSEEEGYRIKYDGHPTAKANEEIAQILYNHINKL